jgi:hypothetical protein
MGVQFDVGYNWDSTVTYIHTYIHITFLGSIN